MSSSASIAAARRRRAGGANQPPGPSRGPPPGPSRGPPPPQATQQIPSSNNSNIPPNPLMILQQHHAKINMLDEQIKLLLNNQEIPPPAPSSNPSSENQNLEESTPTQQRFDLNEITDLLLSRIEQTLDLKVFYDNDQRLASEIEGLNKIILQQQSTLNDLNKLLYFIISNLNLELKEESFDTEEKSIIDGENINLVIGDHLEEDSMTTQHPTFPKSVKIDLNNNETNQYTPIEDDDGSNYEPGTEFTEDGLPIPPVD
jgi:hypothetical protein